MEQFAEIFEVIEEGFRLALSTVTNPDKRVYYLYLITSMCIAIAVYFSKKRKVNLIKYLFAKKVWWSKSALIDYYFVFFNSYVKIILIGPYLISGLYLAFYTNEFLISSFGYSSVNLSLTSTLVLYTISLTLIGDFTSFIVHYLMHKVPFLWEFHKVHHSAEVLNPLTQYRIHPVELLFNNLRGIVVFGVLTGIFDYFSEMPLNKITIIGINAFHFFFLLLGANLRHSHVKLRYWNFLEHILISPFQHQIHHSDNPKHFDKNMGSKFALWDWMFGTLVTSKNIKAIRFGIGKEDKDYGTSFWVNLFSPFQKAFNTILKLKPKKGA